MQEVEAIRTKKARTLLSLSADLVSIQSGGVGCVLTQSDVLLTLIDAGGVQFLIPCMSLLQQVWIERHASERRRTQVVPGVSEGF